MAGRRPREWWNRRHSEHSQYSEAQTRNGEAVSGKLVFKLARFCNSDDPENDRGYSGDPDHETENPEDQTPDCGLGRFSQSSSSLDQSQYLIHPLGDIEQSHPITSGDFSGGPAFKINLFERFANIGPVDRSFAEL